MYNHATHDPVSSLLGNVNSLAFPRRPINLTIDIAINPYDLITGNVTHNILWSYTPNQDVIDSSLGTSTPIT